MTHSRVRQFALFTLLLILFTTGCQSVVPTATLPTEATQSVSLPEASETASPDQTTEDVSATASPENAATAATFTPAPTLEDWREAPIMPEISDRVVEIYEEGQRQGRNPDSFSVIGDCQSIPYVFMGPFGRGAQEPDASESHLWNAINYFDSSFKRWSVTSRGGFYGCLYPECAPGRFRGMQARRNAAHLRIPAEQPSLRHYHAGNLAGPRHHRPL